ncbi:hypothetical protein OTK49_02255 [Vibrio coralliirubri]|uniref:hypothetical protein n=1 Tax=Vibrio coralliirubri TaxID=1516159 RepID=UPI0022833040|nr:hypothetical protein [Vibrio coralliirubri]MCY9861338.1 hypothetical protein [Vibrio coralliirubri]
MEELEKVSKIKLGLSAIGALSFVGVSLITLIEPSTTIIENTGYHIIAILGATLSIFAQKTRTSAQINADI